MKIRFVALGLLALVTACAKHTDPSEAAGLTDATLSTPHSQTQTTQSLSSDAKAAVALRHRLQTIEIAYQDASRELAESMNLAQQESSGAADNEHISNRGELKSELAAIDHTLRQSAHITPPQLANKEAEKALAMAVIAHQQWALSSEEKINNFFKGNYSSTEAADKKSENASRDEVAALGTAYQLLNIPVGT